jgi:hypothetical protein
LEILSSSRDLLSLPVEDDVGCCSLIGTRRISSIKMAGLTCASRASSEYTSTCKPCTQSALGLYAAVAFHQQQHIKGDRETALACQKVVLKCCGHELIESP